MHLHCPDWRVSTHTRGAVIRWRQFSGRLQFLSSLSGSTTGMQSSRMTSMGVWREQEIIHIWRILNSVFYSFAHTWSFFNLPHVSVCLHTPSALWGLSSSMVSSSTSCCPLGSESSAGYDSWTQRKAEVACTLTLKHTRHDQVKNSFWFILTYIVVYKRVLPSYHIHVGWSHHSGREPHHQMSQMSETLL